MSYRFTLICCEVQNTFALGKSSALQPNHPGKLLTASVHPHQTHFLEDIWVNVDLMCFHPEHGDSSISQSISMLINRCVLEVLVNNVPQCVLKTISSPAIT